MTETTLTAAGFLIAHGITTDIQPADTNPSRTVDSDPDREWSRTANHWTVTFHRNGDTFTTPFSTGPAFPAADLTGAFVLDTIAGDAASIDSEPDFESWAAGFGYDTDSRSAEATFRACQAQAADLAAFLGAEALHELMYETERM